MSSFVLPIRPPEVDSGQASSLRSLSMTNYCPVSEVVSRIGNSALRNAKRTCRCEPEGRGNLRKPCRAIASRFPSFGKLRTGCCPPCTSFGRTPRNDKRMVLLLPIPPHLDLLASSAILEISFSENKRHPRLSLGGE